MFIVFPQVLLSWLVGAEGSWRASGSLEVSGRTGIASASAVGTGSVTYSISDEMTTSMEVSGTILNVFTQCNVLNESHV